MRSLQADRASLRCATHRAGRRRAGMRSHGLLQAGGVAARTGQSRLRRISPCACGHGGRGSAVTRDGLGLPSGEVKPIEAGRERRDGALAPPPALVGPGSPAGGARFAGGGGEGAAGPVRQAEGLGHRWRLIRSDRIGSCFRIADFVTFSAAKRSPLRRKTLSRRSSCPKSAGKATRAAETAGRSGRI